MRLRVLVTAKADRCSEFSKLLRSKVEFFVSYNLQAVRYCSLLYNCATVVTYYFFLCTTCQYKYVQSFLLVSLQQNTLCNVEEEEEEEMRQFNVHWKANKVSYVAHTLSKSKQRKNEKTKKKR